MSLRTHSELVFTGRLPTWGAFHLQPQEGWNPCCRGEEGSARESCKTRWDSERDSSKEGRSGRV